jgi:secreted PhoX family phosphatase
MSPSGGFTPYRLWIIDGASAVAPAAGYDTNQVTTAITSPVASHVAGVPAKFTYVVMFVASLHPGEFIFNCVRAGTSSSPGVTFIRGTKLQVRQLL